MRWSSIKERWNLKLHESKNEICKNLYADFKRLNNFEQFNTYNKKRLLHVSIDCCVKRKNSLWKSTKLTRMQPLWLKTKLFITTPAYGTNTNWSCQALLQSVLRSKMFRMCDYPIIKVLIFFASILVIVLTSCVFCFCVCLLFPGKFLVRFS